MTRVRRGAAATDDVMLVYLYAIPVFVFLGLTLDARRQRAQQGEPGRLRHAGRESDRRLPGHDRGRRSSASTPPSRTYRFGLDPDNHGIPIVTSSLDLLGALSLILAIVLLGLT